MSESRSFDPPAPPTGILNWSMEGAAFASRRSQALADYWAALVQARAPQDAMAAQLDYWTHMIDDYALAAAAALAPFLPQNEPEPPGPTVPPAANG